MSVRWQLQSWAGLVHLFWSPPRADQTAAPSTGCPNPNANPGTNIGTFSAGRGTGKGGRKLSYTAVLDLLPSDEFDIKLDKKQIKLITLGSTEEE